MTPDLQLLATEALKREVRFLLVGGYAINAHGYSRKTYDIDLMIRHEDTVAWREIMKAVGYDCFHEQTAFLQFAAPDRPQIDLLRVNEETFSKLLAESRPCAMYGAEMRVPSLFHLIAMKLHAAKNAPPHRRFKDLIDIFYLVDANRVDVSTNEFRDLCARHGTPEIYADIVKAARQR